VPNSLPSQEIPNSNANKKNVSSITLRIEKQTMGPALIEEPNFERVRVRLRHKEKDLDVTSKIAMEPFIPVSFPQRLTPSKEMLMQHLRRKS